MKKIQILYPDPQMEELRRVANRLDRPVSEIVREATADWLLRWRAINSEEVQEAPPIFSAGVVMAEPALLRRKAYERNE